MSLEIDTIFSWPQQGTFDTGKFSQFIPSLKDGKEPLLVHGDLLKSLDLESLSPTPLQWGRLHETDVVFSTARDSRGNFLTSLRHIQGTVVQVRVLWLVKEDRKKLFERINSQNNLRHCRLDHISLGLDDGPIVNRAWTFLSCSPHLTIKGRPLAHTEHSASKRFLPFMNQSGLRKFIEEHVGDSSGDLAQWLSQNSVEPLEWALITEEA